MGTTLAINGLDTFHEFVELTKTVNTNHSFTPSWAYQLKHPDPLLTLLDSKVCSIGNIMGIVGKPGSGKSSVIEGICALAENVNADAFGFQLTLPEGKTVLYVDTERDSDLHYLSWLRFMSKAQYYEPEMPKRCRWHAFRNLATVHDRKMEILRLLDEYNIGLMIIDGIRDFVRSINDEGESTDIIHWFQALMEKYQFGCIFTLHDNPKESTGKGRGHIGTEIYNNCRSNFQISFDRKTDIRTLTTNFDFGKVSEGSPKLQTYFRYDTNVNMMVSCEAPETGGIYKNPTNPKMKLSEEIKKMTLSDTHSYTAKELCTRFVNKTGLSEGTFWKRLPDYLEAKLLLKSEDESYYTPEFIPY